jgi:hypothetical protein
VSWDACAERIFLIRQPDNGYKNNLAVAVFGVLWAGLWLGLSLEA